MKKIIFSATVIMTVLFISCNNQSDNTDSKTVAKEANDQMLDSAGMKDMKGDAKFAVSAADGGMAEVQLSKLAASKSANYDVKQFAQMMVDDHTKANEELKALAAKKNITLPTSVSDDNQKKYDKLSAESGADFDKDYADRMVSDHKNTVDLFKKEVDNGNDSDLKAWATATLPTLEHHLQMADSTQERVKRAKK